MLFPKNKPKPLTRFETINQDAAGFGDHIEALAKLLALVDTLPKKSREEFTTLLMVVGIGFMTEVRLYQQMEKKKSHKHNTHAAIDTLVKQLAIAKFNSINPNLSRQRRADITKSSLGDQSPSISSILNWTKSQ